MSRFWIAAALAAALCWADSACAAAPAAPYHVGETMRRFHPEAIRHWRGAETQALITMIWYPVDADLPETPHDIGESGRRTFRRQPFVDNAPPVRRADEIPVALLSHGTADSLDWLAAALAARGYIVAGGDDDRSTLQHPLRQCALVAQSAGDPALLHFTQ